MADEAGGSHSLIGSYQFCKPGEAACKVERRNIAKSEVFAEHAERNLGVSSDEGLILARRLDFNNLDGRSDRTERYPVQRL